ncbi:MAG: RluA family pseudouridine synthase [Acidobacteria bacterium]|nr:RluA family pseudouridine synthase [Acidobacteriota bacterium]
MSKRLELMVSPDSSGARLDHFLVGLVPNHSRSQIQKLIKNGQVRIGTRALRPNTPVKAGEVVTVEIPAMVPTTLVPEDLPLAILYEDADLLVLDKPAGMVVHPGAGNVRGTLVHALLHRVRDLSGIGGEERPGIVHRLDRGTSGLMVVAKSDASHVELSRQFQDREVEKEYIALVWGIVHAGRRIDTPIGRDPSHRALMSARARRARSAVTRITKAQRLRGVTLAHVAIATGRTHQIRVHLSSIGHPVVGDPLYGGIRRHLAADHRPLAHLERPFLHAARLAFTHPRDGRRMEFTSPLPADLREVLDQLE